MNRIDMENLGQRLQVNASFFLLYMFVCLIKQYLANDGPGFSFIV